MSPKELGCRVKALRTEYKLSQQELAGYTGLHYNTIYNIEKGTAHNISLDTINRIAVSFGLETFELLRREPEK